MVPFDRASVEWLVGVPPPPPRREAAEKASSEQEQWSAATLRGGRGPAVEHRRAADLCVPSAALREVVAEAGIGGRQRPCGAFCGEEFDSYGRMGEGSRALTGWRMSRRAWRAGPTGPLGPLLFPRSHAASFLCYGD